MYDAESAANLAYYADEGALVERGTQIAQVYSPGYSQTEMTKLRDIQDRIKAYYLTLLAEGYSDAQLQRLDTAVDTVAAQIRSAAQGQASGNILYLKRQLERAMAERQTYLRQKYPNDTRLESYFSEEKTQRKRIESWTVSYIADRQSIVSFYTDGYEKMLTPQSANDLTVADVRSVLNKVPPETTAAERARTAVYRLVEPRGFYIALISQEKNWHPVDGGACRVAIEGLNDLTFDAQIISSARTGGDMVVRLYVDADVRPVMDFRQARVTVAEPAIRGIQVPTDALYTQDGRIGVVLDERGGLFVPVAVLTRDTKFAIIQPEEEGLLREGVRVRRF
jgi:hypothetical protein